MQRGCELMKIARATFYYKAKEKSLEKLKEEMDLRDRIEKICLDFPRYGYRRVTKQLQREDWIVNHKRVLRIMRENDLLCRIRKRIIKTTDSDHSYPVFPNLIKDLITTSINQVWVSDITYIRILTDFIYLAVILDLYSRKVIGYALSRHIDTKLTLSALRMAISDRNPAPGCIHHSDRGVQYASSEYVNELRNYDFEISMSRKGNPYDNATCESFIKTLKDEEVYLWEYRTIEDAQRRIPHFIKDVYNEKRLHSALGYLPPNEFEELLMESQKSTVPCQIALT
ncbi:MAG: IS3 family transposase [Candidatus Aerophobetes bacterium]|nr:IS3 family transposase [Candidatus Aerophobetes bacterium]